MLVTAMGEEEKKEELEPVENQKVVLGMLIAILVIGGIVAGGYLYSKKKGGQTVLPAGYQKPISAQDIECDKARPAAANIWDYYGKCDRIKLAPGAKLETIGNVEYNFAITLPSDLKLAPFPNGMGIAYKEIAPNINLLYSIDLAASRSGELSKLTGEDYVRNYWRQYSGLTGIKSLETITNNNGNKAYKAVYIIGGAQEGNQEIFFELGEKTGNFVHFTRGILDQPLYDSIINSFKYPSDVGKIKK